VTTAATIGRPCRGTAEAAVFLPAEDPDGGCPRTAVGFYLPGIYVTCLVGVPRPQRDFNDGLTSSVQPQGQTNPAGSSDAFPFTPWQ